MTGLVYVMVVFKTTCFNKPDDQSIFTDPAKMPKCDWETNLHT